MYLIFDMFSEAFTANAIISMNMRLAGNVTVQWADIKETTEGQFALPLAEGETEVVYVEAGKFALLKPDEGYMGYVSGYAEANLVEWFGEEGE
jgi:hypothetical protein